MRAVLSTDPHNRSGGHPIKKLEGVPPGEGQWRLAFGRFRFRYDITGTVVELVYCGLRRKDTYPCRLPPQKASWQAIRPSPTLLL